MPKKTRDAIEILERLTGDDPELREMIAEETVNAHVARMIYDRCELTEEQQEELAQALAEVDRGEGVDGWQFLAESEIVLTPEGQSQLWQSWAEKGPQGPIQEDDEPKLP